MDSKTLEHALIYIADYCPSELYLKESEKVNDDNGFSQCKKKCIECWVEALELDINVKDELL